MVVRELFTKLGLISDKASFELGGTLVERMKRKLGDVGQAALEAAEEFVDLVQGQAEAGKALHETAQVVGLATDELQKLDKAATLSGVAADTLHHGLLILSRTMAAAKAGGEEQGKAFAAMGVKYKDANGHLRSAGDVLGDLADHFSTLPDGAEKTAAAMSVLGRSGAELIPLLNQGGKAIEEMGSTAILMTEEQIQAGKHLILTEQKLAAVSAQTGKQIANGLIPAIDRLVNRYYRWKKASVEAWQPRIAVIVEKAIKAIDLLGRAFTYATVHAQKFGVILGVIAAGAGAAFLVQTIRTNLVLADLARAFLRAGLAGARGWLMATLPIALLIAAVVGAALAIEDLWVGFEGGKSAILENWPDLAEKFKLWKAQGKGFWQGFADDARTAMLDLFYWIDEKMVAAFNATFGKVLGAVRSLREDNNDLLAKMASEITRRHIEAGETGYTLAQGYDAATGQFRPTAPGTPGNPITAPPGGPMTAPAGGGSTTVIQKSNHVTVHANGVDPAGVVRAIKEHMDTTNEETLAAVGG